MPSATPARRSRNWTASDLLLRNRLVLSADRRWRPPARRSARDLQTRIDLERQGHNAADQGATAQDQQPGREVAGGVFEITHEEGPAEPRQVAERIDARDPGRSRSARQES